MVGALLIMALAVAPAAPKASAVECVSGFYSVYQHMPRRYGIPDAASLAKLKPFLSRRLQQLIARADKYRVKYERENPGDKPPFVDGDLFSSSFEGFTRFSVGHAKGDTSRVRVPVHFELNETRSKHGGVKWTDIVVVIQEGEGYVGYVIDDIEFGASWPFANHGKLRQLLKVP